jgi:hypothetical protein
MKGRKVKEVLFGGRGEGGWIWWKYALRYKNRTMRNVETILRRGKGCKRMMEVVKPYCKLFYKCHNVFQYTNNDNKSNIKWKKKSWSSKVVALGKDNKWNENSIMKFLFISISIFLIEHLLLKLSFCGFFNLKFYELLYFQTWKDWYIYIYIPLVEFFTY